MKKYFLILFLSCSLSLLLTPFLVFAKNTFVSTYYPSPSGAYTKLVLMNGANGPDGTACFCAKNSVNASGKNPLTGLCDIGETPVCSQALHAGCVTYSNAGTIFSDPNSGYLEICNTDGTVNSFPGTCFNRYCNTGASCPPQSGGVSYCPDSTGKALKNYQVLPNSIVTLFTGVTSYVCCFSN